MDEAARILPDEEWWIKSDGCDVVQGLTESMKLEWGGDVDLGDDTLQRQYEDYLSQLTLVKGITRNATVPHECSLIISALQTIKTNLDEHLLFAPQGIFNIQHSIFCVFLALKKANDKLCEKLSSGKRSTDKEMAALSWTVDELSKLNSMGRDLYIEVNNVLRLLEDPAMNLVQQNVSRRIISLKNDLLQFIRGITRYKRSPATHILVTMISQSQRNKKPYALPVSCIPYAGLTEAKARKHINLVVLEMTKRNMKVAGEYQFIFSHIVYLQDI